MNLTENEEKLIREKTREILRINANGSSSLIPILQQIQESLGYVPEAAMREVASQLNIPEVDVFGIVTFYNQFRLHPPGKQQVKVCLGTACHMKGGHIILDCWERRLGIKVGETTKDREFSLERVACVGCCTMAPVTLINDQVHPKMTPTRVDGILHAYQMEKQKDKEEGADR
ncbi:MAG: NADH-quinone oxidoreductase subunit NuoE [Moorella sp. (in: Bacteria)]|nr:NADH-quinone oxidoreductase subunit NuoE [Moorella sp. (in: firmicutes)]